MTQNGGKRKRPYRAHGDARVPFACAGWNDAAAGRPFNYQIVDAATRAQGIAYERGRAEALALIRFGLPVPGWRAAHTVPPRVRQVAEWFRGLIADTKGTPAAEWPVGESQWLASQYCDA